MTGSARPLDRIVQVDDRYYVLACATLADNRVRILKDQETFAVLDRYGDLQPITPGYQGLYVAGTRFLDRLSLRLAGGRPLLLGSTVRSDQEVLEVDLTNPELDLGEGQGVLHADTIHLRRVALLVDGSFSQRLTLHNFGTRSVTLPLTIDMGADYVDVFEVRGTPRPARGEALAPVVGAERVCLSYRGLDEVVRRTTIGFAPAPEQLTHDSATYAVHLDPGEERQLEVTVRCQEQAQDAPLACELRAHEEIRDQSAAKVAAMRARWCKVSSSNELFDAWLARSFEDLRMLTTETSHGPYPYAGTPWFSTVFGRDGIVTALETLWVDPTLSRGVLRHLAATQATEADPAHDAEPGKILHESRRGEMAALGEIPFGRYYGSVDGTPLFVFLAGRYLERTGDLDEVRALWPSVQRALEWIDRFGDVDGDGFVEYQRRSGDGLVQQGWKDSGDSVFDAAGRDVEPPVALCEVQAYVYGAYRMGARIAAALGEPQRAQELAARAEALRERFERSFWSERLGCLALALDGAKRRCEVLTSNAGQCLLTGVLSPARAARVAEAVASPPLFNGWGVRTLAAGEPRYNPLSYHNGSVWPHDNALIAAGLARYGFTAAALRIFDALFAAARGFDMQRLPELFCGFPRASATGGRPVQYPVACLPQAWAAGAPYLLLQAALGLRIHAAERQVELYRPQLPEWLRWVELRDLQVNGGPTLDLLVRRHRLGVVVEVHRREDEEVRVVVVK